MNSKISVRSAQPSAYLSGAAFSLTLGMRWLAVLIVAALLVACGGGGSGDAGGASSSPGGSVETPPSTARSFSLVSPQDTAPISFLCGDTDGDASQARYPKSPGSGLVPPQTRLVALPDGSLLGSTSTTPPSYFLINAQGQRTAFAPRAVDQLRVDTEGKLWWVDANRVLWRGALQADGKDERIGNVSDFVGVPTDGPTGSATLGSIKDFAAVPGAVYMVMRDSSASHSYLRRLSRDLQGGWQVSTLALPASVIAAGDSIQIRSNPNGLLALLSTHTSPGPSADLLSLTITYWQLGANNAWQSRASKSYQARSNNATTTLNLDSVALNNSGDLIWGGGGNARLYQMGQDGSWTVLASPSAANAAGLGQDGSVEAVTFLTAYSVVTGADGHTVFYDGSTCQVRKLTGKTLATLSGPRYTSRAHFAQARLLGFDSQGNLVLGHQLGQLRPPTPLVSRYNLTNAGFTTVEGVGILAPARYGIGSSDFGSEGCYLYGEPACASLNWQLPVLGEGRFLEMVAASDTLYAADADGKLMRSGPSGYVAIANPPPQYSSIYLPQTPATFSTPRIVGGHFPYFVGEVSDIYAWYVALRLNAPADTFSVVAAYAGKSEVFPGKSPYMVGKHLQARNDGGFWTAGNYGVARINSSGDSTDVAGCLMVKGCPIGSMKDGQGASATFDSIARIRVLPDNRLLVLDKNAVRLVDDAGKVSTLFTLADSGLPGSKLVDMIPSGRDVYLTLDDQPRLALAKNVLP